MMNRRFKMKKRSVILLASSLFAFTSNGIVAVAAAHPATEETSVTLPVAHQQTAPQLHAAQGQEYYHSVRFSIDFMETIMAGDSEPRGRFYQALQEAIGAPVIFYDFWNDYIVIKIIDKKLTPEEAEIIKNKINSLDWLYDTYGVPRDQEFITDIHWFDRWS